MTVMRGTLSAVLLAAVFVSPAGADDYRFEVRAALDRDQPDGDFPGGDPQTLQLSGTWYFAPVSTEAVPLAEAAFLGKASNLSAVAARFEVFDEHLNAQAANIGYYFPGGLFFASAGVSRSQNITAINSQVVLKETNTRWFGALGVTPLDGLLVTTDFDENGYDPNITARHVGKLPNAHFYAGSVGVVKPDGGDTFFRLDFDYYFDDTTSAGIGYADGSEAITLRGRKFFSQAWALGVSAYTADGADGFNIEVTWRH
jgi:hypothetical protein